MWSNYDKSEELGGELPRGDTFMHASEDGGTQAKKRGKRLLQSSVDTLWAYGS